MSLARRCHSGLCPGITRRCRATGLRRTLDAARVVGARVGVAPINVALIDVALIDMTPVNTTLLDMTLTTARRNVLGAARQATRRIVPISATVSAGGACRRATVHAHARVRMFVSYLSRR